MIDSIFIPVKDGFIAQALQLERIMVDVFTKVRNKQELSLQLEKKRRKNNSHCPALWLQGCTIGRSSTVATLKGITGFSLFAASSVSGSCPAGLGKPRLLLMCIHV
jgi:hypothetical protein